MSLVACVLLAAGNAHGAEYICRYPNGQTLISDRPCVASAKTTYANTGKGESQEMMDARKQLRAHGQQKFLDEREAERRQRRQQAEQAAKQHQAQAEAQELSNDRLRQQMILQELQLSRQGDAARRAAAEAAPKPRLSCFQYGDFMDCKEK